jgi:hypothetical protein
VASAPQAAPVVADSTELSRSPWSGQASYSHWPLSSSSESASRPCCRHRRIRRARLLVSPDRITVGRQLGPQGLFTFVRMCEKMALSFAGTQGEGPKQRIREMPLNQNPKCQGPRTSNTFSSLLLRQPRPRQHPDKGQRQQKNHPRRKNSHVFISCPAHPHGPRRALIVGDERA